VSADSTLVKDVSRALYRDLRVDDREIAVSADAGAVTLRGTVGSFGAKIDAARTAERVAGVESVHNELEVRLLTKHRRDDAELRGSVLKVLSWNALVPDEVDATVENGAVTLRGTVDFEHQREEAWASIRNLHGVTAIHDEIKVKNADLAADVARHIEDAFRRIAETDARAIRVDAVEGTVTLDGFVTSWAERNAAIDAARSIPGVERLDDRLGIAG